MVKGKNATMPKAQKTALTTLWLAVLVIALDQLSKIWVLGNIGEHDVIAVLPNLNFILAFNEGAAFSFLSEMGGAQRWLFTGLAVVVVAVLLVWLKKLPAQWSCETAGINLIIGGAIGNGIDRVLSGKVTDFIDFYIGSWHYATFNVADIAISIGAFCLIVHELWLKPKEKVEE
jgi:signal peptidase II